MKVLVPKTITPDMLTYTSIAEPDASAGEVAWVSGQAYAKGAQVIRLETHRKYQSATSVTSATPPESDPTNWVDMAPTNRWAAFDGEVNTASTSKGSLTVRLQVGFFNAIGFQALVGGDVRVVVRDGPGGAVEFDQTFDMYEAAAGLYEYLFADIKVRKNHYIDTFPILPAGEIEITFSSVPTETVGAGLIAIGDMKPLHGDEPWSRTANGAQVEPITYSVIKENEWGQTTIKRRHKAKNLRAQVLMEREAMDYVIAIVHDLLDVPVLVVGVDRPGFAELQAFGLLSAVGTYQSNSKGLAEFTVKGLI